MMIQWRAGLRISEALDLEVGDLHLAAEPRPVLKVRQGKGRKDRLVPIHGELQAALSNHIRYKRLSRWPTRVCQYQHGVAVGQGGARRSSRGRGDSSRPPSCHPRVEAFSSSALAGVRSPAQ